MGHFFSKGHFSRGGRLRHAKFRNLYTRNLDSSKIPIRTRESNFGRQGRPISRTPLKTSRFSLILPPNFRIDYSKSSCVSRLGADLPSETAKNVLLGWGLENGLKTLKSVKKWFSVTKKLKKWEKVGKSGENRRKYHFLVAQTHLREVRPLGRLLPSGPPSKTA